MKKFSKIVENLENGYYKIEATVELIVQSENSGEAGYLADSILSGIEECSNYTIDNIDQTDERITENNIKNNKKNMKYLRRINEQDQPLFDNEDWFTICDDPKKVEDLINEGGDINYKNSTPLRICCRGSWQSREKYGEGYYDSFIILCKNGVSLVLDGNNIAIKYAAEYGRIDFIIALVSDFGIKEGFVQALSWSLHSRKITDDQSKRVRSLLNEYARKYEPELLEEYNKVIAKNKVSHSNIKFI